ncbi:hypothetical protein DACRYDRAFT_20766 [Dacryopinax primogenitus]|uniref:Uncharacterized protein n=1 Tax=Dacryopinax primogenitus (strain DJM 731) TaxID=1858805 RepID=M5G1Q6_DACPD|nr:uncharacterized protein DACRYDRAFT_20766 [Dacryopinax primogenitus]EJU04141.1 hypothetical protein DACRYDRAFT_20766 [Dacryopinax primogenitus]
MVDGKDTKGPLEEPQQYETPAGPPPGASNPPLAQTTPTPGYATFPGQPIDPRYNVYPAPGPDPLGYVPMGNRIVLDLPNGVTVGPAVYYYPNGLPGIPGPPVQDPRAICAAQGHVRTTTFGIVGILTAIICFPIGLICCALDRREVCARCGEVMYQGC